MEADFLFHESTKTAAWQHLKEVLATNQPHRIIISECHFSFVVRRDKQISMQEKV
ncbi:hypothetical protein AB7W86_00925 [Providencia rettgeri]